MISGPILPNSRRHTVFAVNKLQLHTAILANPATSSLKYLFGADLTAFAASYGVRGEKPQLHTAILATAATSTLKQLYNEQDHCKFRRITMVSISFMG